MPELPRGVAARMKVLGLVEDHSASKTASNGATPVPLLPVGQGEPPDTYFLNTLRDEADRVTYCADKRNHQTFVSARNLAELMSQSRGLLTERIITDTLMHAGRLASPRGDHPFPDWEIAKSIEQGLNYGERTPRQIRVREDGSVDIVEVGPEAFGKTTKKTNGEEPEPLGRRIRMTALGDIRDDVPTWAWRYNAKGRIQLGTLALFAGRPGAGKSTAARWFAAQASLGLLEGCWHDRPQNVAYIAPAEESARFVIKPGLRAARADFDRFIWPEVYNEEDRKIQLLSLLDENALTALLIEHNVTVVIVDPVMSTISAKVDVHRNNEARAYVEPWARIADAINGVVIGVVHLRKQSQGDLVAAITGSSAFGEVARAVFGFVKDPDSEEGDRVMSQAKNSTGYEDLALTYRIEPEEVMTDGGPAEVGLFNITGTSEITAEQVLNTIGMTDGSAGSEVRHWLADYLEQNGATPSKDVKDDARKEGFSEPTVKRAAAKLRVKFESNGFPRRTYWRLPIEGEE